LSRPRAKLGIVEPGPPVSESETNDWPQIIEMVGGPSMHSQGAEAFGTPETPDAHQQYPYACDGGGTPERLQAILATRTEAGHGTWLFCADVCESESRRPVPRIAFPLPLGRFPCFRLSFAKRPLSEG
jgi:hypothetical protein